MDRDRLVGFLLLMPLVALILGLTVYPITQVISMSLHQQGLFSREATFSGLANFQAVLGHEAFTRSIRRRCARPYSTWSATASSPSPTASAPGWRCPPPAS